MKNTLILLSFCMSFLYAQNSEDIISDIRTQYQWINAQKDFTIKELNNEDYLEQIPDQGAQLKGYFKKDTLYKIVDWFGLNRGNIVTEYYLWKGEFIFVYQRERLYKQRMNDADGMIGFDYSESEISFESRAYFKDGLLVEKGERGKRLLAPSEGVDFQLAFKHLQASLLQN